MKVLGLILELNPYHQGHKYFIEKAIKDVRPDITIAVISSAFSMRGDAIVLDKFTRTKILLATGVDLVFELPFLAGVNGRDLFAKNAISILNDLKMTDLAFGCEEANLAALNEMMDITKSDAFLVALKDKIKQGYGLQTAEMKAFKECCNDKILQRLFHLPNINLGMAYIKAASKDVKVHLIKRIRENDGYFYSATEVQDALNQGISVKYRLPDYDYDFISLNTINERLYYLFKYKIITSFPRFKTIKSVNEGIENRILKATKATCFSDFIKQVKCKRYQENKIKRICLYFLLDVSGSQEMPVYLRMLGSNNPGLAYIHSLPRKTKQMIFTSFKNKTNDAIEVEIKASKLLALLTGKDNLSKEYRLPIKEEE